MLSDKELKQVAPAESIFPSPIPVQCVSSDDYMPCPQTEKQREFEARIKNFDRFAVIVEVDGADHLVFKHAIATIATQRSVPNYLASQHP